jgi:integrase
VFRANGEKQRGPWVDSHKEAKRLMVEKQAEQRNSRGGRIEGTIAELIDMYVTKLAINEKGEHAWGATKGHELRRIQEDELVGHLQVREITRGKMVRWAEHLKQVKQLSRSTVLTRVSYLNKVLTTAFNRDWEGKCTAAICQEMAAAIATMREEKLAGPSFARDRLATREEIDAVRMAAQDSNSYVDLVAVIDVLSRMPLRLSELLKLTKADLNGLTGEATLYGRKHPDAEQKERSVEVVPMIVCPITGVSTFELVMSRLSTDAAMDAKPYDFVAADVSNAWIAACKKAGVEGLTLHDLRAFSITNLLAGGVDCITVAKLSGHKNPKTMAAHYSRQSGAMIAATIRNSYRAPEALTAADIRTMIATLQRELAVAEAREAASGPQLKLVA